MTMPRAGETYQPHFAAPPDPDFHDGAYRDPGGRALANPGLRLGAKLIARTIVVQLTEADLA